MFIAATILCQSSGVPSVIGWSLVLIALIVVAFFAVIRLRQWMQADEGPMGQGFSLSDLRELHRQGKMTDAEFEKAKTLIVAGAREMAAKMPSPLARSQGPKSRLPRRGDKNVD